MVLTLPVNGGPNITGDAALSPSPFLVEIFGGIFQKIVSCCLKRKNKKNNNWDIVDLGS